MEPKIRNRSAFNFSLLQSLRRYFLQGLQALYPQAGIPSEFVVVADHAFLSCQLPCDCAEAGCHFFYDGGDPLTTEWPQCCHPAEVHLFTLNDQGQPVATPFAMQMGEAAG